MVYVVTGGTSGIGYYTALHLLRRGKDVIITGRDQQRLEGAVQHLRDAAPADAQPNAAGAGPAVPAGSVEGHQLNLGSLQSVTSFAEWLVATCPRMEALVLNAGLQCNRLERSREGVELTWACNHLGHFYLVQLLLPHLRAAGAPCRIVSTSSGTHDPKNRTPMPVPHWGQPSELAFLAGDSDPRWSGALAYTNSKLCNILFVYELARREAAASKQQPLVTALAYDPGFIPDTRLSRALPELLQALLRCLGPLLMRLARSPQRPSTAPFSGSFQARLAMGDPALGVGTAEYWEIDHKERSSPMSYEEGRARELWEYSKGLLAQLLRAGAGAGAVS